jgi:hypothetical protein
MPEYYFQKLLDDGYIAGAEVILLYPNQDLPETNSGVIPIMDFETSGGIFKVEGYVTLPKGTPRKGVVARIVGPAGVYDTSIVDFDKGGLFTLLVSGAPVGYTNYLLSFMYDPTSDSRKRSLAADTVAQKLVPLLRGENNIERPRNLADLTYRTPCAVGSANNEVCPPDLTITLSWDGPTSDLDLHVQEGGHGDVFFGNPEGYSGRLVTGDDTYGFGPEIYLAATVDPMLQYGVYVHAWNLNDDSLVNWALRIEKEGLLFGEYSGTFTQKDDISENIYIDFETAPKCGTCPIPIYNDEPGFRQLADKCDCLTCEGNLPPLTYEICESCSIWFFSWNCKCVDAVHPATELYQMLSTTSITDRDQLVALVAALFAPGMKSNPNPPTNMYLNVIDMVESTGAGDERDLDCLQEKLLAALCKFHKIHSAISYVRALAKLNSNLSYMKTIATAASDIDAVLKLLSSYIKKQFKVGAGDVLDEVAKLADFGLMKTFFECSYLTCRY